MKAQFKNHLSKKSLAIAVAMAVSTTSWGSGAQMNTAQPQFTDLFTAKSFIARLNAENARPEVINDLDSLLGRYKTQNLSAEEVGRLASEVEYGMRLYGYDAVVNVVHDPHNKSPLCLEITLGGKKATTASAEEITKQLQAVTAKKEQSEKGLQLEKYAGTFKGLNDAEDKGQWAKSTATSMAQSVASEQVNKLVGKLGENVKSQIQLTYDEENLRPTGKLLIPVYDTATQTYFTMLSLNEGYDDRYLGHVGFGGRFYPNAETLKNRGNWGFGANVFYDYDFTRGHKRYSLGGELFYDTLSLSGNVYQRLSGWKDSEDFDSYLVQERPANGWDVRAKWALPWYTPLQFTGGYTQWYGDHVAPFGASSKDDLMEDPSVYDFGASINLTKAISLNYSHKKAEDGHDNQVGLNFNIPLDNSIVHAFDLAENGEVNTINQTPYAFVDRDENMILEYRERSNRFGINYLGQRGVNVHEFGLETGLDSGKANQRTVTVTPHDKCVVIDQGGLYVTDNAGRFDTEILSTLNCPQPYNQTTVTVQAGETSKDFTLQITPNSQFKLSVSDAQIFDDQIARLNVLGAPNAVYAVESSWVEQDVDISGANTQTLSKARARARTSNAPFNLYFNGKELHEGKWFRTDESGNATLDLVPDASAEIEYEATVTLTAATGGQRQSASVLVGIFEQINWGDLADGELVWGDSNKNGLPDVVIDISGGTPGEEIVIDGPGMDSVVVIPEKPVFDENGNGHFIIEQKPDAPTDNTEITIGVGDNEQTIVIVPPEFNPDVSINPANPGYGENFTVNISDAKPGSIIHFEPTGPNGECVPNPSDVIVDKNGNAQVEFSGVNNYVDGGKVTIDIEIAASANSDETKVIHQEITLEQPEINWDEILPEEGELVMGDSDGDGKADITIDLDGGVPGQPIEIGGEDLDKVTITPNPPQFDSNGNASITIEEKDPNNSEDLDLTIGTGDGEDSQEIVLTHGSYSVRITAPESVDYGTENTIEVQVAGAKPNSEVKFLPIKDVTVADPASVTADELGNATSSYAGITDYKVTELDLVVEYVAKNDGTTAQAHHKVLLKDPELKLETKTTEITEINTPLEFVLSGGKEGETIEYSISGDGELDGVTETIFDAEGKAKVIVKPKSPYEKAIIVTAKTLERTVESTEIAYNLPTHSIQIDYSELNFKGKERTIDYDTPFKIKLSGLTPNTPVILNRGNEGYGPKASQIIVNEQGEATFEFEGISDTSIDDFRIDGIYQLTNSPNSIARWSTEPIHLYQWGGENGDSEMNFKLPDGAENQVLDEFNSITITISGGKPNSPIDFGIEQGSAEIVSSDSQTDEHGNATVTIQAKKPYQDGVGIIISADHMGNHMESEGIPFELSQVIDTGKLDFEVTPTTGTENEIDYDTPYEVKISGLIENSTVTWDSNSDVIPTSNTSIANLECVGQDEARTCSTKMSFKGISNYALSKLGAATSAIRGHFAKNAAELNNPSADFVVPDVNLKQYSLSVSHDGDAFLTDEETMTFTLSGGKANQALESVELVASSGELTAEIVGDTPQALNGSGEATFSVKLTSPYYGSFKAVATYMGGKKFESEEITAQPIVHEVTADNITVSPTVDGTSDTIDYRTNYIVSITADNGLIDGTEVKWDTVESHGIKPTSATSTVSGGKASMEFEGISDAHITEQSLQIQGTYYKTRGQTAQFSKVFKLKQYTNNLAIDGGLDHIDAGQEFTVKLSGSRATEQVTWTVTQGSEAVEEVTADPNVNSSGEAVATYKVYDHATAQDVQIQATVLGRNLTVNLPIVLNQYDSYIDTSALGQLDYNKEFSVTVKNVRKNSTAQIEVLGANAEVLEDKSDTATTENGDVVLTFKGIDEYDLKEISLRLTYMLDANTQNQKVSTISMKPYALQRPSIDNGNNFAEGDKRKVTVTGGIPGAPVTWQSSSTYFVLSDEDAVFDPSGNATAMLTATIPATISDAGESLSGKITVSSTQQGGASVEADVTVSLTNYGNTISLDVPTADYNTALVVGVEGARPQTQITAKLMHGADELGTTSASIDDRGEGTLTFEASALSDFTLKDNLSVEYTYQKLANTQETKSQSVTLKSYSISLSPENAWAMNEDEEQTITVTGGKEGADVTWDLQSPYFTLSEQQTKFDVNGEATAKVTTHVDPDLTRSRDSLQAKLTVSSSLYGGLSVPQDISVNLTEYDPKVELSGISELDYSQDFALKVTEARPGTEVSIALSGNDGVKIEEQKGTVLDDGTVTLNFAALTNFALTNVKAELSYKSNAQTQGAPKEFSFDLKDYSLIDSNLTVQDGNTFAENQTKTVTVSGGKEGATVNWSVDGYFELSEKQTTFNAQGQATAKLTAKVPDTNAESGQLHGTVQVTSWIFLALGS